MVPSAAPVVSHAPKSVRRTTVARAPRTSRLSPLFFALLAFLASPASAAPVDGSGSQAASSSAVQVSPEAIIAGVVVVITGLLLCFLGTRLWRVTVFCAGFYVFASLAVAVLLNVRPNGGSFELTAVSLSVGVLGGCLASLLYRVGVFLVGTVGGLFLSVFILSLAANGLIPSTLGRLLFILFIALVAGLVTLKIEKHVVILSTAVAGAFLIGTGVDCLGAYTGLTDAVWRFIQHDGGSADWQAVGYERPGAVYGLLVGMVVLAIAGTVVQYRRYTGLGSDRKR